MKNAPNATYRCWLKGTIGRSTRRQLIVLLFFALNAISCGLWPEAGKIVKAEVPQGPDIAYGIIGRLNDELTSTKNVVIALPTGYEQRRDVVRDMNNIWSHQARKRDWIFVCPASSQGFPFDLSKDSKFGLGGERLIPYFLKDLRQRQILQDKKPFLVDIWGNGNGLISVVNQARGVFEHVILAPSAIVDLDLIKAYDKTAGPNMTIVLGKGGHNRIDNWFNANGNEITRIRILRIPIAPPYRTRSSDRTMEEIGAEYAEYICDYIANDYRENMVRNGSQ